MYVTVWRLKGSDASYGKLYKIKRLKIIKGYNATTGVGDIAMLRTEDLIDILRGKPEIEI